MQSQYFFLMGIIFITINTQAMSNEEKKAAFFEKLQKEHAAWLARTANQKVLPQDHTEIITISQTKPVKNNHKKSSLLRDLNIQHIENETLAQLEEMNPKAFTIALYQESKQDN